MSAIVQLARGDRSPSVQRGEQGLDAGGGGFRHADIDQPMLRQHVDMGVRSVAAFDQRAEEGARAGIRQAIAAIDDVRAGVIDTVVYAAEKTGRCLQLAARQLIETPLNTELSLARCSGKQETTAFTEFNMPETLCYTQVFQAFCVAWIALQIDDGVIGISM